MSGVLDIESNYNAKSIEKLENEGALENKYWTSVSASMPDEDVWITILLINEKQNQGIDAIDAVISLDSSKFDVFFQLVVGLASGKKNSFAQKSYSLKLHYLTFLVHLYQSMEKVQVRQCCIAKCFSLHLWKSLSASRLASELKNTPALQKHWDVILSQQPKLQNQAQNKPEKDVVVPAKKAGRGKRKVSTMEAETEMEVESNGSTALLPIESWIPSLLNDFISSMVALNCDSDEAELMDLLHYLQKFSEFLIDVLSQLSTRRFLRTFIDDIHLVTLCESVLNSKIVMFDAEKDGRIVNELRLLRELLLRISVMMKFEIDDLSGNVLTSQDMVALNNSRLSKFQQIVFSKFGSSMKEIYFSSLGQLGKLEVMRKYCSMLMTLEQMLQVFEEMAIFSVERDVPMYFSARHGISVVPSESPSAGDNEVAIRFGDSAYVVTVAQGEALKEYITDILCFHVILPESQLSGVNQLSLYPSEELLWDLNQLPASSALSDRNEAVNQFLTLPKLNLQFLTLYDYLLRNFVLFRLESAYEIREDIMTAIRRMVPQPGSHVGDRTTFSGWSRMALPISQINIEEVSKPKIGEVAPASVTASIEIDLKGYGGSGKNSSILAEWEALREHDIVFMVCVQDPVGVVASHKSDGTVAYTTVEEDTRSFRKQYGIKYVRGGEVIEVRDEDGVVLNDFSRPDERKQGRVGLKRRLRIRLDASQYYNDMKNGHDCYSMLNVVVKRQSKENTFKPVLETIRDLMNTACNSGEKGSDDVPAWLHDTFLGYGAVDGAHYRTLLKNDRRILNSSTLGVSDAENSEKIDCSCCGPDEDHKFEDTFLDAAHVVESFAHSTIPMDIYFALSPSTGSSPEEAHPFPIVTLLLAGGKEVRAYRVPSDGSGDMRKLPVAPYHISIWHNAVSNSGGVVEEVAPVVTATPSKRSRKSTAKSQSKKSNTTSASTTNAVRDIALVTHYETPKLGPYPEDIPLQNRVRFTRTQIEAIRSGMNKGLTMVVGPPGTGKTDTAVQTISNLYHNHPNQRILLITHSNAALNDLFEKIMERNIPPRHLLRLGAGELELRETLAASGAGGSGRGQGEVFSKHGRVQWCLSRRLQLLEEVQRLGDSLNMAVGDVGATCETAEYFYCNQIKTLIESFLSKRNGSEGEGKPIADIFPFSNFFVNIPNPPLFNADAELENEEVAVGCIRHIVQLFVELRDYKGFELLRSQAHRSDYMLMKQARIVAMTCTHAAMARRKFIEMGFKFDSVVVEEAAQILEVETLIPMLLQRYTALNNTELQQSGANEDASVKTRVDRLKRVMLIGDHHQLPPVIKHQLIRKFSHLDQSLFTRFIRLGVPHVLLDQQGRARPEIASLYSWRYRKQSNGVIVQELGNLPFVKGGIYSRGNAGFLYPFQMVNVPEFQGKGEYCPTAHFYQNLGEAEYVVATYQYMRLIGYPAASITILTTYNGQKALIKDILKQRCELNVLFGLPGAISTVDQYQGQQNDYVLLSLVRTEHVGHIRDVRRLVVAMSRARLGLYVFCRMELFMKCLELQPVFKQMVITSRDDGKDEKLANNELLLLSNEYYPTERQLYDSNGDLVVPGNDSIHPVCDVTAMGVLVYQMVQLLQSQE